MSTNLLHKNRLNHPTNYIGIIIIVLVYWLYFLIKCYFFIFTIAIIFVFCLQPAMFAALYRLTRESQKVGPHCLKSHTYVLRLLLIKRRGRVVNTPASYSGGPEFKSRVGEQLSS
jgi:hypothetical protein